MPCPTFGVMLRRSMASAILKTRGAVAQLGECLNGIEEVEGSSPSSSTIEGRCEYPLRIVPNPHVFTCADIGLSNPHRLFGYSRGLSGSVVTRCPPERNAAHVLPLGKI
jgi:hypothetical protein